MLRTLALSTIALTFAGAASASTATVFTAKLETPKEAATQVVVGKYLWSCEGDTCTAELKRKKPTVRTCQKVAQEVGKFVSFQNKNGALTEEQLENCNSAAK